VFAIAKFLVHLFGEGRGGLKWEGRGKRKRVRRKGKGTKCKCAKN